MISRLIPFAIVFGFAAPLFAAPATQPGIHPPFRTDASADDTLPWFQLVPGEFPPLDSWHAISGELIALDHVNRTGVLRPDRTDAQRRGDWDKPLAFTLLPYGSLRYHGAPAELRDIPIGTHLHGLFYVDEQKPTPAGQKNRVAVEAKFSRVLTLEDDFSHAQRLGRSWKIESVALDTGTLNVTPGGPGVAAGEEGSPAAKPIAFQIAASTRVWKGRGVGTLADLAAGQQVLLNLTVCTLKGPGRVTHVWLDAESRDIATAHQLEVHRQFQREHGLAARVDSVDHKQGIVTATLFGGFDPKLLEDFVVNESVTAAVAEENLRTWDQINDRKAGPLVEILRNVPEPGSSGVQLRFKPSLLLEGFRPKRIVRIWAGRWKVDDLPLEERLYP